MSQTRITVTGAAGYIGSRVVSQLRKTHPEWDITAVDNFYRSQVREIGDVEIEHVDVRHRNELSTALDGSGVVLHLAAVSGVDDCDNSPDLAYDVNVVGTNNVAWHCRKQNAGLVFPFSMASLGDPTEFPITTDLPRDPLNWYGRSKAIGERAIETYAEDAFPAHMYMISNVYGEHEIDGETVSKGTVVNFFVNRALSGQPLTVYEPGTQARNYIHVNDVARAYIRSTEELLEQLKTGETGVERFEIASDEDPSVQAVAEQVAQIAGEERDIHPDVKLVENPRSAETLVESFAVDTSRIEKQLGWEPHWSLSDAIRGKLSTDEATRSQIKSN